MVCNRFLQGVVSPPQAGFFCVAFALGVYQCRVIDVQNVILVIKDLAVPAVHLDTEMVLCNDGDGVAGASAFIEELPRGDRGENPRVVVVLQGQRHDRAAEILLPGVHLAFQQGEIQGVNRLPREDHGDGK